MNVFSRPLVALSLTGPDDGLLRYALRVIADGNCETVRFVHVVADEAIARDAPAALALRDRMQREVELYFGGRSPRAEFEVVFGSRLDQLLTLAAKHRQDVILLGHRRGRSGRRSLARHLAMVAPCSVWLVPEGPPERVGTVLVPVDFSKPSADALALATALAAGLGARQCLALHVFFDPSTLRYPEHLEQVCGQERSSIEEFIAGVDCHGVRVESVSVESTHPAQAILRLAERHEADLIVMGTRGRTQAAALLLGSVTSEIMTATTVPVLAVKHFGSHETLLEVLLDRRFWHHDSTKTN